MPPFRLLLEELASEHDRSLGILQTENHRLQTENERLLGHILRRREKDEDKRRERRREVKQHDRDEERVPSKDAVVEKVGGKRSLRENGMDVSGESMFTVASAFGSRWRSGGRRPSNTPMRLSTSSAASDPSSPAADGAHSSAGAASLSRTNVRHTEVGKPAMRQVSVGSVNTGYHSRPSDRFNSETSVGNHSAGGHSAGGFSAVEEGTEEATSRTATPIKVAFQEEEELRAGRSPQTRDGLPDGPESSADRAPRRPHPRFSSTMSSMSSLHIGSGSGAARVGWRSWLFKHRISASSGVDFAKKRIRSNTRLSLDDALKKSNLGQRSFFVINPESSSFLKRWDLITMAALAYVAIVAPVQVSMMETEINGFFFFNCFIDCLFFIDLWLQFFLMYPIRTNYGYKLENRHRNIVVHYLKTWFVIDFISIVPFDLVGLVWKQDSLKNLKAVKAVRLLRLLKLVRIAKASRVFSRFETRMSITYGRLALLKFFVILAVITHWLANLWALTLILVEEDDGMPRWIDAFDDLEKNVALKTKDNDWMLYIACLYFTTYTITSVGYGDIGPKNIVERTVCTSMIIISGISWAVVLGQVCGIVANLEPDEQAFRSTMDELNYMMHDSGMPVNMRHRLRSFFLSNKLAQRRMRHQNILSRMSPGLQGEVVLEMNRRWICKIGFLRDVLSESLLTGNFRSKSTTFMVAVSRQMWLSVHAQSEVFGDPQTLYILNRGLVGRQVRVLSVGAVWGMDFVLSDNDLAESPESFALTYVEVTTLKRKAFLDVLETFKQSGPEIYHQVRRFCAWLAVQRKILKEAKVRQSEISIAKSHAAKSVELKMIADARDVDRLAVVQDDWTVDESGDADGFGPVAECHLKPLGSAVRSRPAASGCADVGGGGGGGARRSGAGAGDAE